jgi:hypothetical protein
MFMPAAKGSARTPLGPINLRAELTLKGTLGLSNPQGSSKGPEKVLGAILLEYRV